MNNQKDTEKTNINYTSSEGVNLSVSNEKSLIHRLKNASSKKTEKLVTALYMVTDCMETDDALKSKLRLLGVELLSDMYRLSTVQPMDKDKHILSSLSHVHEVISFVEIACTIGFISEMNTVILKREFMNLIKELESYQSKDKHFTFTLDEKMFDLPVMPESNISNNNEIKRTTFNTMSVKNNNLSVIKRPMLSVSNNDLKKDRSGEVISIFKNLFIKTGTKEFSIKDISNEFTNCSEKTIQRELNSLVSKGQVKKSGAKRWSRYQLA